LSEIRWSSLIHPVFELELNNYEQLAANAQSKVGQDWVKTKAGKKFLVLNKQVRELIPNNLSNQGYRLGDALGNSYTHWFRAKFLQQYRIFFRYSSRSNVIVYAWVNNDDSLRTYESKTDAYQVFRKMLESGRVPNSWDELVAESKKLN
jgi:toxin YhaV